jgi:hypothetical protein
MGEVADVLDLLLGFEVMNGVCLEVRLGTVGVPGEMDLGVQMYAHDRKHAIGEVPSLASASVRCLDTGLKNLRDVVTHVLYALDFQLVQNELSNAEQKSVPLPATPGSTEA